MSWVVVKNFGWVAGLYLSIGIIAIAFDIFGDRSGGAVSLASIPIAALAMGCFLIGQFCKGPLSKLLFVNWLFGAILVFAGLIYIGIHGASALKDGELVFTYAMLMIAPPASFVLPFFSNTISGFDFISVALRALIGWGACLLAGMF